MKRLIFLTASVIFLGLASPSIAQAQSCLGSVTCCLAPLVYECNPGCISSAGGCIYPLTGAACGGSMQCTAGTAVAGCGWNFGVCMHSLSTCNYVSGSCFVSGPPPTVAPTATPVSGPGCSGSNPECQAIANCGVIGKVGGSGSCPNPGDLCCVDSGGGGGPCTIEFQAGPAVMYQGDTATFSAFARGAINWWDGYYGWRVGHTPLGTFTPWAFGTGPTFTSSFTATTLGTSTIWFRATEDGGSPVYCEGLQVLTVIPRPESCTIDVVPNAISLDTGLTQIIAANTTVANGTIANVFFTTTNAAVASVTPGSDAISPYSGTITANGSGATSIEAVAVTGGGATCFDSAPITVTQSSPWWQIGRGNAITPGGVRSLIPGADPFVKDDSSSGFPGVVIYGTGSPDFAAGAGAGTVSSEGWLAQTVTSANVYTYDYFNSLASGRTFSVLPAGTDIRNNNLATAPVDDGYRYIKVTGNASISAKLNVNNAQKRVVLFVEGDLSINNDISIDVSDGFFMAIVRGNVIVGPDVIEIDGIYTIDNTFRSGTDGNDPQLVVTGSVVAGALQLQRDLTGGNGLSPAEIFNYSPELVVNFPPALSDKHLIWREVAP